MKPEMERRKFLGAAAASGAFTIVPRHVLGGQGIVAPSDKITVGYIGCGTEGLLEFMQMLPMRDIQVVAVCDPVKDSNEYVEWGKGALLKRMQSFLGKPNWRASAPAAPGGRDVGKELAETYYAQNRAAEKFRGVNTYADFRELLAKEKDVDAVKVMTPDHLHATILIAAMKQGKHAIVHKPLANRLREAKLVFDTARQSKVATFFMPYGSGGNLNLIKAWIKDGAIGTLREVHNWTNRPMWPNYAEIPTDRPPIPKDFDWDLWLGPALYRPYHPNYTHTVFRGWYDFGGGSIADMGHYSLWPVFTAFNFPAPVSVESTGSFNYEVRNMVSQRIRNDFSFPMASAVRFKIPAHDEWPDLDLYWYDGGMRPSSPRELDEDGRELGASGMMFVGDKGKILDGRIIPESKMKAYPGTQPPAPQARGGGGARGQTAAQGQGQAQGRSRGQADPGGGGALADWIQACRGGPQSPGNFLNAIPLTEAVNLHAVALRAGRKLQYDPAAMTITNVADASKYLTREYRQGWEL
jgi:predicted dehydrogenase